MPLTVSDRCLACIIALKRTVVALKKQGHRDGAIDSEQVADELDRFNLWLGDIGAIHWPHLSYIEIHPGGESSLRDSVLGVLGDLEKAASALFSIAYGQRQGVTATVSSDVDDARNMDGRVRKQEQQKEKTKPLKDIGECITQLFQASRGIRQDVSTGLLARATSERQYVHDEHLDTALVSERFPKLKDENSAWLQRRLGRAITERRRYLRYIRGHRETLDDIFEPVPTPAPNPQSRVIIEKVRNTRDAPIFPSRPSTLFTNTGTSRPQHIKLQTLTAKHDPNSDDDKLLYTNAPSSLDSIHEQSSSKRVPSLRDLRKVGNDKYECTFCFRLETFPNEHAWTQHVYADLRPYVCTFRDCDAPYFADINTWFRHEMQVHRVHGEENSELAEHADGDYSPEINRNPVERTSVQDCPCCSDWQVLLREQNAAEGIFLQPDDGLTVSPQDFKQHLGSHMEHLALLALPIISHSKTEVQPVVTKGGIPEGPSLDPDVLFSESASSSSRPFSSRGHTNSSDDIADMGTSHTPPELESAIHTHRGEHFGSISSLREQRHFQKAETMKGYQKAFGRDHLKALGSVNDLAETLESMKMYEVAEKMHKYVSKERETLGANHLNKSSTTLDKMMKPEWQLHKQTNKKADKDRRRLPKDWDLPQGKHRLGQITSEQSHDNPFDNNLEREQLAKKLQNLADMEEKLGMDHPNTLALAFDVVDQHKARREMTQAIKLLERILKTYKESDSEAHPNLIEVEQELAETYQANGQTKRAIELLVQREMLQMKAMPEDAPALLGTQQKLAAAYMADGQVALAKQIVRYVSDIQQRMLPNGNPGREASEQLLRSITKQQ